MMEKSAARKYRIIQQITKIEDEEMLYKLENFLNSESSSYRVSEEHQKILEERLQQHGQDKSAGESWEKLKSGLKDTYGL